MEYKASPAPLNQVVRCVEVIMQKAIIVTPNPCPRIEWGNTEYRVEIDTDPKYEDLDFPIKLVLDNGDSKPPEIQFEPEDADAVGHALIRAAAIRRSAFASNNAETVCDRPQDGAR